LYCVFLTWLLLHVNVLFCFSFSFSRGVLFQIQNLVTLFGIRGVRIPITPPTILADVFTAFPQSCHICLKISPSIAHRLPLFTSFSNHYSLFITHHEIGRVCSMYGERICVRNVLVGKPEGKTSLGRPGLRWKANIKMDQEIERKGDLNWIDQARDKGGSISIKCR